jgi:hypothetical protein
MIHSHPLQANLFNTNIKTTIQLVINLGVKNEDAIFTKNDEIEREVTVSKSTSTRVEAIINQILSDIFDTCLSSHY